MLSEVRKNGDPQGTAGLANQLVTAKVVPEDPCNVRADDRWLGRKEERDSSKLPAIQDLTVE